MYWCCIMCSLSLTLQETGQVPVIDHIQQLLLRCAEESLYYDEVASLFTSLQTECRDFVACLKQQKVAVDHLYTPRYDVWLLSRLDFGL